MNLEYDKKLDWLGGGPFTAKGNNLYHVGGEGQVLAGFNCKVKRIIMLGSDAEMKFSQIADKIIMPYLPKTAPSLCPVIKLECDGEPPISLGGGMRTPNVPHPHHNPVTSDIQL